MPSWTAKDWMAGIAWGEAIFEAVGATSALALAETPSALAERVLSGAAAADIDPRTLVDAVSDHLRLHAAKIDAPPSGASPLGPGVGALRAKFQSNPANVALSFGDERLFMRGLDGHIGRVKDPNLLALMAREHLGEPGASECFTATNASAPTTPRTEWNRVMGVGAIAVSPGDEARGRDRRPLSHFLDDPRRAAAGLLDVEVIAVRLYTGPMFVHYNRALRDPAAWRGRYVATIHVLASAVLKLARVHSVQTVYRGLSGGILPAAFYTPGASGACGGTELGFMSTTTRRSVARDYARASDGGAAPASVVFRLREGAIDRGADVSWLSQFPRESEVLFPPLTHLEVVGAPRTEGSAIVMDLRPNVNLRMRTVEELMGQAKAFFLDTVDHFLDDVRGLSLPGDADPSAVHPGWLDALESFRRGAALVPAEAFNRDGFYRRVVDQAMDLKQGTLNKLLVIQELRAHAETRRGEASASLPRAVAFAAEASPADFASKAFCMGFVRFRWADWEGGAPGGGTGSGASSIMDHASARVSEEVWDLPLGPGSWSRVVGSDSAPSAGVRVSGTDRSCVSALTRALARSGAVRRVMVPVFGQGSVDAMVGASGDYTHLCSGPDGLPLYQQVHRGGHLANMFLYHLDGRWRVGPTPSSPDCAFRSRPTALPLPPADGWERAAGSGFRAVLAGSSGFAPAPSVRVARIVPPSLCPASDGGDACAATPFDPLHRSRASSLAPARSGGNDWAEAPSAGPRPGVSDDESLARALLRRGAEAWSFLCQLVAQGGHPAVSQLPFVELQSMATFCAHVGAPVPDTVKACLRDEHQRRDRIAALWSAFMFTAVALGALAGATMTLLAATHELEWLRWLNRGFWAAGLLAALVVCLSVLAAFARSCAGYTLGACAVAFVSLVGTAAMVSSGDVCGDVCLPAAASVAGLIYCVFGAGLGVILLS